MQGFCHRCGDCCEDIPLKYNANVWHDDITTRNDLDTLDLESIIFIVEWWQQKNNGYWRCSFFNSTTRLCEAGDLRPPICKNYPWYDREPEYFNLMPKCGYWYDLPQQEWPEDVKLLPIME